MNYRQSPPNVHSPSQLGVPKSKTNIISRGKARHRMQTLSRAITNKRTLTNKQTRRKDSDTALKAGSTNAQFWFERQKCGETSMSHL